MPLVYSINKSALLKILLHSASHPSYSINGLLIGRKHGKAAAKALQGEPGSPSSAQDKGSIEILDCLPLFHTSLSLSPMAEVGLIQAEAFARSKGLQLIGYYQANEQIADVELGGIGKKITERIQSYAPEGCALLVDNSKLQGFLQQKEPTFLQLHVKEGGKTWTQLPPSSLSGDFDSVPREFLTLHGEGRHHKLVDFDDHLNDISKDWLNRDLL